MEQFRELWTNIMAASEEAREIAEITTEEAAQGMTIANAPESAEIVVEIPK